MIKGCILHLKLMILKNSLKYQWESVKTVPNIMGQYFLYEKIEYRRYKSNFPHEYELFYPKIAVYLHMVPCDMAMEIEFVNRHRTWEDNAEYYTECEDKDGMKRDFGPFYISCVQTEIQRVAIWDDDILIYGLWDTMPDFKQLKRAYESTYWFKKSDEEIRDIKIRNILL